MEWGNFAVPSVCILIFFLAYSSQVLFLFLDPHPLEKHQVIKFNILLVCLWISYARSVRTDPGRIPVTSGEERDDEKMGGKLKQRWCRKCEAVKPPRAHHCKVCGRCIPKMDHHCPWTANCVSHTTFPHFLRFLFYAVTSMLYLWYFIYIRTSIIWENRNMPIIYGPEIWQLIHLFLLCVTNFFTTFALSILLIRNIWCLAVNTTTIEGWEIERHKALVRRARYFGGYLEGPDGSQVRIERQEYPYDVGIWENMKQGMGGTGNILSWFFPLSPTPSIQTGLSFPTNGFTDPSLPWPPPDPDRMTRRAVYNPPQDPNNSTYLDANLTPLETMAAFKKRQEEDLIRRRKPFMQRLEAQRGESRHSNAELSDEDAESGESEVDGEGEEGWRNSEGERLADFGVDEEVEFYDEEDDLPLSVLLARRRMRENAAVAME